MKTMSFYIIAGLSIRNPEDSASEGITVALAKRLRSLGARVVVASHHEWREVIADIRSRPAGEMLAIAGHSLGGSVAPEVARQAGREIAAIYGFDPAENIGANSSAYKLTLVPPNVKLASAIYVPGGFLGGGQYSAEDPRDAQHPNGKTTVKNKDVPFGHMDIDNDIERHLAIEETARILMAEA